MYFMNACNGDCCNMCYGWERGTQFLLMPPSCLWYSQNLARQVCRAQRLLPGCQYWGLKWGGGGFGAGWWGNVVVQWLSLKAIDPKFISMAKLVFWVRPCSVVSCLSCWLLWIKSLTQCDSAMMYMNIIFYSPLCSWSISLWRCYPTLWPTLVKHGRLLQPAPAHSLHSTKTCWWWPTEEPQKKRLGRKIKWCVQFRNLRHQVLFCWTLINSWTRLLQSWMVIWEAILILKLVQMKVMDFFF